MANLHLILIVAAFVCALLATLGVPSGRYNLIAAALACGFRSLLVG
jgi:hypothetical protein